MERRDLMKLLATMPMGAWLLTHEEAAVAVEHTHALLADAVDGQPRVAYKPKFFQSLEWRTVRVLSDMVIPRDARSGSATDAGVPEFMDFVMITYTGNQTRMREGLGWLNAESRARFGVPFPDAKPSERTALLDDIAFPKQARPEHREGVRFFNAFRDLCASGFFTSRIGVKDIGYMGNVPVAAWTGCSSAALEHLGVK